MRNYEFGITKAVMLAIVTRGSSKRVILRELATEESC